MANSIQDFKSALIGGGARSNLFEVTIPTPPPGINLTKNFPILCKSAALPESTIAPIEVPFRGRSFKVAGERAYGPWSVTIINDERFEIREAMERWMQKLGQYADASGDTNPNDYMCDAYVKQFTRTKSSLGKDIATGTGLQTTATYRFYDIFPTSVSAIELSYENANVIEEFTVEFQVQYWTPSTKEA